ncbi:hypothetical protein C900_01256 [Fulvivirga imtechensis AK7]|uniref:Uncharacterized protein n=1 Tax=Fulvivirga imtechensis AK7 TaxID=1237149 RepID=L8JKI5_9BACT|nr:hypothetical protein C900_01256 [Fulvivirga imtechensis AK7]
MKNAFKKVRRQFFAASTKMLQAHCSCDQALKGQRAVRNAGLYSG